MDALHARRRSDHRSRPGTPTGAAMSRAVDQPAGEALFNASKPDPWPKSALFVVPAIQGMDIRTG